MNNFFPMMEAMARNWIKNQEVHDGDYYVKDILYCGKCKKPRQEYSDFTDPTPEDRYHMSKLKRPIECDCDIARRRAEENAQKERERRERIAWLRAWSCMDETSLSASFENFETNKYNEKILRLCKHYAEKFSSMYEKSQGLILWGNVGTGKSYAAACIANYLMNELSYSVVMISFTKFLERIQNDADEEDELIERIESAKLVIFDDLGSERNTNYALEKVYNAVDIRYKSKKPMIFTTNLTLEEMKQEEDIRYRRIFDRIFEFCYPIEFTGLSWRKKTAAKRFKEMEEFFNNV